MVNHEENHKRWDGLHLDSLIKDHLLAYVGGPLFVNPIFCSLSNGVLSVCMGVAIMWKEAVASVSFQKKGPRTLYFFVQQSYCQTQLGLIHFHVLVMPSLRNLRVVKRQHVEEFARRLIFPISQAAVAVSEKSSSHTNYFKCHKTHFLSIAG